MMKMKKWGGWSLLGILALVLGLLAPLSTVETYAASLSNGWTVDGAGTQQVKYRNDEAGQCDHLYIYDDNNNELDAFCLNRSLGMDDSGDFSKRYLYDAASETYTYKDKDGNEQTVTTPVLVGHFLANQNKPSSDQVLNWASDNANAIKYMKKALYYGYVGKAADLGVSDDNLYDVTQDAVWQISHFGRGWENGSVTSRAGGMDFTHGDLTAVDKLLKEYVFNNDVAEPDGQLIVGHGPNTATGQAQHVVSGEFEKQEEQSTIDIKTTVKEGSKEIKAAAGQTVVDTVTITYSGITAGSEYTLKGQLIVKDTEKEIATSEKTITLDKAEGTQEVEIEFTNVDATDLAGKTLVVFEALVDKDGKEVAKHQDLNSTEQAVTVKAAETENPKDEETNDEKGTNDGSGDQSTDEPTDDSDVQGDNDGNDDEDDTTTAGKSSGQTTTAVRSTKTSAPRTSDEESPLLYLGILLLSLAGGSIALTTRR